MYDKQNIFARIIRGELPCKKIYEDESVLAFEDIDPVAPEHFLVIPKGEFISLEDFTARASCKEVGNFFKVLCAIAEKRGLKDEGYRIITNIGENSGQTVFHFHAHVLGKKKLGSLLP
jgi:diadenosine tetraphosphate (Ap4A) HIT family hydrolase